MVSFNFSARDLINYGLMGLVLLAFLGFVASSGWDLLQAFVNPQSAHAEHDKADLYEGMTLAQQGELLFISEGCMACHNLDLLGGFLGPSLNNVRNRWNEEELRTMIVDPNELVPNTYMPSFAHLGSHEIDALVAFLGTLTQERKGPDNTGTALVSIPANSDGTPKFTMDQVEAGKALMQSKGCIGCHSINGFLAAGVTGPNLTYEGLRGRSDEWQAEHIRNPLSVYISGSSEGIAWKMGSFSNLSGEELTNIVAYLQSLNGIESLKESYSEHCPKPDSGKNSSTEESKEEASPLALLFQKKYCSMFEALSTSSSN